MPAGQRSRLALRFFEWRVQVRVPIFSAQGSHTDRHCNLLRREDSGRVQSSMLSNSIRGQPLDQRAVQSPMGGEHGAGFITITSCS